MNKSVLVSASFLPSPLPSPSLTNRSFHLLLDYFAPLLHLRSFVLLALSRLRTVPKSPLDTIFKTDSLLCFKKRGAALFAITIGRSYTEYTLRRSSASPLACRFLLVPFEYFFVRSVRCKTKSGNFKRRVRLPGRISSKRS
jgi:hypothetical protein